MLAEQAPYGDAADVAPFQTRGAAGGSQRNSQKTNSGFRSKPTSGFRPVSNSFSVR